MREREARYINVVLGIWLFISAFVWTHSSAQFTNTWLMGVIAVVCALLALGVRGFRYVNTAVGLWLIISTFSLPHVRPGTAWNNVLVGIAIAIVSLIGSGGGVRARQHVPA